MSREIDFVAAAVAAAMLTGAMTWTAVALGFVSKPNQITADSRKVALGGGVSLGLAVVLVTVVLGPILDFPIHYGRLILLGLGFVFLGLWDDLNPLSPGWKFAWQAVLALAASTTGAWSYPGRTPYVLLLVHFCLILTLVNALNFTDVCDGLVAGISVVAFLGINLTHPDLSLPNAAMAGACLGFWMWNRPPARIFLGDSGSHFIGFMLAEAIFSIAVVGTLGSAAVQGILFAAVPLFETVLITATRVRLGLPWWKGSPHHFSMQLQMKGWTKWQVIGAAAFSSVAFAFLAWLSARTEPWVGMASIGVYAAACAGAALYIVRPKSPVSAPPEQGP